MDTENLALVLVGAFVGGFTNGFAGFGTGLVASGLWFYALPAATVPPLVIYGSFLGQLVGLIAVRKSFQWRASTPLLVGGILGVPLGVWVLGLASAELLRLSVGVFLVVYSITQFLRLRTLAVPGRIAPVADGVVGVGGGFLGGFSGLSGPLPLMWLQLKGGTPDSQRAVYQPFNLIVIGLAGTGMFVGGHVNDDVIHIALWCTPVTLGGVLAGLAVYRRVSPEMFKRAVLVLLMVSGAVLTVSTLMP